MGFAADLNKLCERAGEKAALVVRRAALELQSGMIEKSPVDTGRFRSNFQCGIGALNKDTSAAPEKSGSSALGRTETTLQG